MSDDKPTDPSSDPTIHGPADTPAEHPTVEQGPVPPAEHIAAPAPAMASTQAQPQAIPKQRFVDRVWGFKSIIAVALASVIIGGLGGAALARGGDHQGRNDRMGFGHGPGQGFGQGRGPGGFGPPGQQRNRQGNQGRGFGQQGQQNDNQDESQG